MVFSPEDIDYTNDIILDVWRSVLLAAPGMAHLVEDPPVAAMGAWRTLAGG